MVFDYTINLGNIINLAALLLTLWGIYSSWAKRMSKLETKINIMFMYFRKGLTDSDREAIDKFFSDND